MSGITGVGPGDYDQMLGAQFSARDNAEQIKNQFLTLLVAQMKNQDPMNPMDNQDFIAQLATFSSLEQLITINDGVENIAKLIASANEKASGAGEEDASSGESEKT